MTTLVGDRLTNSPVQINPQPGTMTRETNWEPNCLDDVSSNNTQFTTENFLPTAADTAAFAAPLKYGQPEQQPAMPATRPRG